MLYFGCSGKACLCDFNCLLAAKCWGISMSIISLCHWNSSDAVPWYVMCNQAILKYFLFVILVIKLKCQLKSYIFQFSCHYGNPNFVINLKCFFSNRVFGALRWKNTMHKCYSISAFHWHLLFSFQSWSKHGHIHLRSIISVS